MPIDRVATYGIFQTTLSNFSRVDVELANLQNQLSSGYKSPTYDGLADQSLQLMQLDDRLARNDLYLTNIARVRSRLESTGTIIGQVINVSTQLKNLIAERRTVAASDQGSFEVRLEALWQQLTGQLNTTLDGQYLFSGSRTNVPAVTSDEFPQLVDSPTPDDGYYNGDDEDLTIRVGDSTDFTYNVRANEDGFQKIFAALALTRDGHLNDDDNALAEAFDLVNDGLDEIISTQAKNNSNIVTLNTEEQNITSLKTYWKILRDDIANADLITVSSQVTMHQAVLQASFQAFAKINSLRLVDFLR